MTRTILVVDDDDDIRLLMRTVLGHAGYEVIDSPTGHGGLALAARGGIDLIMLDLHVPDLDAWSFMVRAWEDRTIARVPIVMFSATDDTVTAARALAWGCRAFLAKPFGAEEILDTVQGALTSPG